MIWCGRTNAGSLKTGFRLPNPSPTAQGTPTMSRKVQINKGAIQDNALKALVKSNLFRHKVARKKKGKGSYNRQQAKKWQDGSFESSCFVLVEAA